MKQPRTWLAGILSEAHGRRDALHTPDVGRLGLSQAEANARIDELNWVIDQLSAKYYEGNI